MQCIDQEDGVKEVIDHQFLMKPDSDNIEWIDDTETNHWKGDSSYKELAKGS